MTLAPTSAEAAALRSIERSTDTNKLRSQIDNSRGKSDVVVRAAFDRMIDLKTRSHDREVARDCWRMIHAVEEIRRQARGRRTPMLRLRGKIAREDEVAALEYLALQESAGFDEVIGYGVPELLAEVLVVKHGTPTFSISAVESARARLEAHDLLPDALVQRLVTRTESASPAG